ncbi:DNA repair protein XRCC1-like isoform X1 [Argonauta hians]
MPEIKIQHIVSYSSQDTKNPADNLLKPDGVHKWRSASAGEKSLSVILQLEKASRIHSIDIGNEGSAFIEVLVGRSTSSSSEDFQVILVTSSFMSPMESRNNTNRCSVRMFGPEKLTKTVFEEKWDRVKIICTQPFNKMTNYGLSFVKFHSPPSSGNHSNSAKPVEDDDLTNPKKIGAFFFRQDEDEKSDLKAGSLFAQQKAKAESSPLTGAAAIRAASNEARSSYLEMKSSPGSGASEMKKKRKHSESDEDTSEVKKTKSKNGIDHQSSSSSSNSSGNSSGSNNSSSLQKARQKEESRKEKHSHHEKKEKKHSSKDEGKPTLYSNSSSSSNSTSSSSSHKNNHHKLDVITNKANNTSKPFRKIMDTVVFVLSGFQNPCRADIRDKAREMGATYRPDWSSDCTHLVCAFMNTPKYKAVKGRGRIVTKNWVLDCYRQKTLLPWRKFQLEELDDNDDDDDGGDDGDGGADDDRKKERASKKKKKQEKDDDEEEEEGDEKEKEEESWSCLPKKKSDPDYLPSGEDQNSEEEEEMKADELDEDTDDELMRLKNSINKTESDSDEAHRARQSTSADTQEINSQKNNDNSDDDDDDDDDDAFGAATDVDEDSDDGDLNCELPVLPDFFSDKHFFLYGDFSESQRHDLTRYIITYNGELEDYMSEKVDFVVTYEQWDDNFDEALSNYPQLNFVKPDWLYSLYKKNKWVPYQLHIVTPTLN